MKHVFIPREGDKERFADLVNHFSELSDLELRVRYQEQGRCGISGVRGQGGLFAGA